MIDSQEIKSAVEDILAGDGELFLVDVTVRGDEVDVTIDSDDRVRVDDCVALTKALEARFDRDEEDFALTVSSAGIGQPLKIRRQYLNLVGESVEVVLLSGVKFTATLDDVGEDAITLSYPEKQKIEGQKRPQIVTVTKTIPLAEIKTTKEHLDFK
jgi:ribosome maturation factor RimP